MTNPPRYAIEILCILSMHTIHKKGQFTIVVKNKKMDMPFHEGIGKYINVVPLTVFAQKLQVSFIMRCCYEYRSPVIAPGIYVMIYLATG